jgi:F-type H+-transporting ATPase subunit gamma
MSVELREVKRRIGGVQQVHKVTRALQMVAAAELQQNRRDLERVNRYMDALRLLFAQVGPRADAFEHPLMKRPEGDRRLLVVFGTERGLCGGFNTELLEAAQRFVATQGHVQVAAYGRVIVRWARRAGLPLVMTRRQPRRTMRDTSMAQLVARAVGQFLAGEVAEVHVLYHRFESALVQRVVVEQVLPLSAFPGLPAEAVEPASDLRLAALEPSAEVILQWLVSEWLHLSVSLAFLNSLGSESAARQQATLRASENAAEILDDLGMQFRRMRQESITEEMLELSGGG